MILRTGIDLIEIGRIQAAWARHGERFLKRLFTPVEVEACAGRAESLAARFASLAAKRLGQGSARLAGWKSKLQATSSKRPGYSCMVAPRARRASWV